MLFPFAKKKYYHHLLIFLPHARYFFLKYAGVPPLLSRRILETLTYLAKNHPKVSKLLLHLELPILPEITDRGRGKGVLMDEDKPEFRIGAYSIVLLLGLLRQPLYTRSVSHLEQVLLVKNSSQYLIPTSSSGLLLNLLFSVVKPY